METTNIQQNVVLKKINFDKKIKKIKKIKKTKKAKKNKKTKKICCNEKTKIINFFQITRNK